MYPILNSFVLYTVDLSRYLNLDLPEVILVSVWRQCKVVGEFQWSFCFDTEAVVWGKKRSVLFFFLTFC